MYLLKPREYTNAMLPVYEAIISTLLSFGLVATAAYVGVLKALEVYHRDEKDSVFLSTDAPSQSQSQSQSQSRS